METDLAEMQGPDSLDDMKLRLVILILLSLAACGRGNRDDGGGSGNLYPGETVAMRSLINRYADIHDIPPSLLHRVIQRESDYQAAARNGPYYGLMQILPETARTMGHRGPPSELLDPEVNLKYAGKYLRGAWLVANGNQDRAVQWYASGYYYEARDRCMLVETGLRDREINKRC